MSLRIVLGHSLLEATGQDHQKAIALVLLIMHVHDLDQLKVTDHEANQPPGAGLTQAHEVLVASLALSLNHEAVLTQAHINLAREADHGQDLVDHTQVLVSHVQAADLAHIDHGQEAGQILVHASLVQGQGHDQVHALGRDLDQVHDQSLVQIQMLICQERRKRRKRNVAWIF